MDGPNPKQTDTWSLTQACVVQQRCEISQNNAKNASAMLINQRSDLQNSHLEWKLKDNETKKLSYFVEYSSSKIKLLE